MKILLLAGTREARLLAQELDARADVALTVSLAGVTQTPGPLSGHLRSGGFGGAAAQEAYLRDHAIDVVVDATHPFAHRISHRSQRIAARLGVAYLQVLRPPWSPVPSDDWCSVASLADVAAQTEAADVVFLGTGPGSLDTIGPLPVARVICRRIDPPEAPFPYANGMYQVARPPLTTEDEIALFRREKVSRVVTKNAGGAGGWPKIAAARSLGLPVVMVVRPDPAPGDRVESVAEALDWIGRL